MTIKNTYKIEKTTSDSWVNILKEHLAWNKSEMLYEERKALELLNNGVVL